MDIRFRTDGLNTHSRAVTAITLSVALVWGAAGLSGCAPEPTGGEDGPTGEMQMEGMGGQADGEAVDAPEPEVEPRLFEGPPTPDRLAVGSGVSCAIDDWGQIHCWGQAGSRLQNIVREVPEGQFTQVSIGEGYACASNVAGHVVCWGNPGYQAWAETNGSLTGDLSAGSRHICLVGTDRALECWGQYPQVNAAPGGEFTQVSAGSGSACAVDVDGAVYCWGRYEDSGTMTPPEGVFRQVELGSLDRWACALNTEGEAHCWGEQNVPMAPEGTFVQLSAGEFGCVLQGDGTPLCFGDPTVLVEPPAGASLATIAVGHDDGSVGPHACGFVAGDEIICWGDDAAGQVRGIPPAFTGGIPSPDYVPPRPPIGCQIDMEIDRCFNHNPLTSDVFDADRGEIAYEVMTYRELGGQVFGSGSLGQAPVECIVEGDTFTVRGTVRGKTYGFAVMGDYAGPGSYSTETHEGLQPILDLGNGPVGLTTDSRCDLCVDETGRAGLFRCEGLGEGSTDLPHVAFRCD